MHQGSEYTDIIDLPLSPLERCHFACASSSLLSSQSSAPCTFFENTIVD
jgi:hypothetical protein